MESTPKPLPLSDSLRLWVSLLLTYLPQGQVSNIKGQPLCPRTCKIIQTSQSTGGPHNLAKLVLLALHKLPPITPLPPPTPLLHSLELPISGCNPLPGPERSLLSFGAVSNQELYLSTTSSIPVSLCCVLLLKK